MNKAQTRLQAEGQWWVRNERLMDYEQSRPVPVAKMKAHAACKTDCSGSVYGIWWSLGFDDPTGGEYTKSDVVYTGTLLAANEHVSSVPALVVGDLVIFGSTESTKHVCFVLEDGADPLLFSHGQDRGPIAIRLSAERAWHAANGAPVMSLRRTSLPSDDPKTLRWVVFNGAGERIGKTTHPGIWGGRHPKLYRKFKNVRYEQRSD